MHVEGVWQNVKKSRGENKIMKQETQNGEAYKT